MKKYLLPCDGNLYKANLHCHSVLSDGRWTPEEIKENYKANGYSVVAYTDHDIFIPHNDLTDDSFLALNGYELAVTEKSETRISNRTCHMCFIALDKERKVQKIHYPSKYLDKNPDMVYLAEDREPITKSYTPEFISDLMREGRDDGFFVTYNHPVWSLEAGGEYMDYHGMHAMEVINYASVVEGYEEYNSTIYDNMLRGGKRIFCVATDDNHDYYPISHPKNDSFGGFTLIKAKELSYSAITEALLNGDFYASEGPEIYELYCEDGNIHIKTSDAAMISIVTDARRNQPQTSDKKDGTINEAVFPISEKLGAFFRIVVTDVNGKSAYTSAYFLDTVLSEDEN